MQVFVSESHRPLKNTNLIDYISPETNQGLTVLPQSKTTADISYLFKNAHLQPS